MNAAVVDLFAGSGAVGIEALSRGTEQCTFVEKSIRHLEVIRDNLQRTGLNGQARLMGLDVITALQRLSGEKQQADLIFIDPPYRSPLIPPVLKAIVEGSLLREDGLVVVEHSAQNTAWAENYPDRKEKKYGDTRLTLIGWKTLKSAAAEKESESYRPDNIE
jgi:16S rRNA (guanine966-N2)-methyltransferase